MLTTAIIVVLWFAVGLVLGNRLGHYLKLNEPKPKAKVEVEPYDQDQEFHVPRMDMEDWYEDEYRGSIDEDDYTLRGEER